MVVRVKDFNEQIVDGLIDIGYEMHIFDSLAAGKFPGGADRNEWKQKRIKEVFENCQVQRSKDPTKGHGLIDEYDEQW